MAFRTLVPAKHAPSEALAAAETHAKHYELRGSNANCDLPPPVTNVDSVGALPTTLDDREDVEFAANLLLRVRRLEDLQHPRTDRDSIDDYLVYVVVVYRMKDLPLALTDAQRRRFVRVDNVAAHFGIKNPLFKCMNAPGWVLDRDWRRLRGGEDVDVLFEKRGVADRTAERLKSEIEKRLKRGHLRAPLTTPPSIPPQHVALDFVAGLLASASRVLVYYGAGLSAAVGFKSGEAKDREYMYEQDVLVDRFVQRILDRDDSLVSDFLETMSQMLSWNESLCPVGHAALGDLAALLGAPLVTTNTDLLMHACGYVPTNLNRDGSVKDQVPDALEVLLCVGVGMDHHGLIGAVHERSPARVVALDIKVPSYLRDDRDVVHLGDATETVRRLLEAVRQRRA